MEIVTAPLRPSEDAVTVTARPPVRATNRPEGSIEASDASSSDHDIARPESAFPRLSFAVAESRTESKTTIVLMVDCIDTDATDCGTTVTVIVAVALSLVAVIVVAPSESPIASPPVVTLTTLGLLLVQVTARPRLFPFASSVLADSCKESEMGNVRVDCPTVTLLTFTTVLSLHAETGATRNRTFQRRIDHTRPPPLAVPRDRSKRPHVSSTIANERMEQVRQLSVYASW